jgi:hypothetical protein
VPLEQLFVAAGTGRIVPDGQGGWRVEAEGMSGHHGDRHG